MHWLRFLPRAAFLFLEDAGPRLRLLRPARTTFPPLPPLTVSSPNRYHRFLFAAGVRALSRSTCRSLPLSFKKSFSTTCPRTVDHVVCRFLIFRGQAPPMSALGSYTFSPSRVRVSVGREITFFLGRCEASRDSWTSVPLSPFESTTVEANYSSRVDSFPPPPLLKEAAIHALAPLRWTTFYDFIDGRDPLCSPPSP